MIRRYLLSITCTLVVFGQLISCKPATEQSAKSSTEMVKAEDKDDMLLLTDRPVNLETPLHYFLLDFTPNKVFFVRWHLPNLPAKVDEDTFHLYIQGAVKKELALTMNDLRTKFKPVMLPAVCACAGNARSFCSPRVPGAQWKNGGMGNALWKGVRLKDILEMAGSDMKAAEVSFNGMDAPALNTTPDFEKSLPMSKILEDEVIVAYEMNGEKLPRLNGYPLKLIVPGWYATYWVGMLNHIQVHKEKYKGYWMEKAYLVPRGTKNGNEKPDSQTKDMGPISKMDVRSVFVSPEPDSVLESGKVYDIIGIAMDGGDGIRKVEISTDKGKTWLLATLEASLGQYSWRHWKYQWKAASPGKYIFKVKATNALGDSQPEHHWNRSGYMRNEIETLELTVK